MSRGLSFPNEIWHKLIPEAPSETWNAQVNEPTSPVATSFALQVSPPAKTPPASTFPPPPPPRHDGQRPQSAG